MWSLKVHYARSVEIKFVSIKSLVVKEVDFNNIELFFFFTPWTQLPFLLIYTEPHTQNPQYIVTSK